MEEKKGKREQLNDRRFSTYQLLRLYVGLEYQLVEAKWLSLCRSGGKVAPAAMDFPAFFLWTFHLCFFPSEK